MSGLVVFFVCLFVVSFLYTEVGRRLGRRRLPRFLEERREHMRTTLPYTWEAARGELEQTIHGEAKAMLLMWMASWPALCIVSVVDKSLSHNVTSVDPVAQQKRIDAQAKRIAELERELGVGDA